MSVQLPSWEIGDICCFTNATKAELQQVLPPLFDALRRLWRAQSAATAAQRVKRQDRLALASRGIKDMLAVYLADRQDQAEPMIDDWLGQMLGPCSWGTRDHFGHSCQKPVPWTKVDMGGGRSQGPSARSLHIVEQSES